MAKSANRRLEPLDPPAADDVLDVRGRRYRRNGREQVRAIGRDRVLQRGIVERANETDTGVRAAGHAAIGLGLRLPCREPHAGRVVDPGEEIVRLVAGIEQVVRPADRHLHPHVRQRAASPLVSNAKTLLIASDDLHCVSADLHFNAHRKITTVG